MITGKNITKTFTKDPILEGINLKIGNNRKVGIVGKNGCGKSTLFKLIVGELDLDEGNIQLQHEILGYIPQEFSFPNETIGKYLQKKLTSEAETYKIGILLNKMEFINYDENQKIDTLSEGQKMKLKIIEVMLEEPTTLLIDEPTNHLDIEGIMWFEKYIKNLDKTIVMISHDREFLNGTVDEIWEIDRKKILRFVGNYDSYKGEKLKLINKWDEEYVKFLKHKQKLEKLLQNVSKIKDGSKRGKAVKAAKKRMGREIEAVKKEKYVEKRINAITFDTNITTSKLMLRFDDVMKKYDKNIVFENLSFEVRGGQKVWLVGPNGTGKTTLVKMIMGNENPTKGTVEVGVNTKVGYFAQKQTHLDYKKNLLDQFVEETGCFFGDAYGTLKKFLFDKDHLKMSVKDLSPGQRARFAFAIFSYNDYDFLILDEPTNHLDIETKEVIESSLKDYKGTLLLVSHDRFFVERVGITHMLDLRTGQLSPV